MKKIIALQGNNLKERVSLTLPWFLIALAMIATKYEWYRIIIGCDYTRMALGSQADFTNLDLALRLRATNVTTGPEIA